jgi:ribulose-5-phosphate 4-epimerase/fuculose-1-phosphate aldolase
MDGSLERSVKQELVDAVRMLTHAELIDHSGHCSARRDASSFYINSGASVRGALTVEDIVAVDLDGKPMHPDAPRPPLEFPIHAEIYRARPETNAVIHTHPQWSTYLTSAGIRPEVVYAQAALLGSMPVMDSPLSINTKAMGERMVLEMGDQAVILLKAHGVVCAGDSLLQCFAFTNYLEENCRRQYMTMQVGDPYLFSDEEKSIFRKSLNSPAMLKKVWDQHYCKLS